jgi:hypothetical protein
MLRLLSHVLPMTNSSPRDEWAALSAAPNALLLASSAEGVFGAVIAHRDSEGDRINLPESGCCRNEALERHSEALHIGRCGGRAVGTSEIVWNIRRRRECCQRRSNLDHRVFADSSGAHGGVNARKPCGTHGRSASGER